MVRMAALMRTALFIATASVAILIVLATQIIDTAELNAADPKTRSSPGYSSKRNSQLEITPKCRGSIDRGTKWLISAMRADGAVGADIGLAPDLGCTAIVGLAFLSQGNTPHTGPHCEELHLVLNAVLNQIDSLADGEDPSRPPTLVRRKIGRNADLFLATLFLSQLLGESQSYEPEVREALERVVAIVCQTQGKDGTWGNESWAPILGTVLGWECLRATSSCGLKVDASARVAGEALLKKLQEKSEHHGDWMQDFYKRASSVRVLYSQNYREHPAFKRCVERILQFAREDGRPFTNAGGEEYLAFFFVTECLTQGSEVEWQAWYPMVRDKIMRVQNADGSWIGHHCIKDRTFCTAAALLTLQAPNLCLPMSSL